MVLVRILCIAECLFELQSLIQELLFYIIEKKDPLKINFFALSKTR